MTLHEKRSGGVKRLLHLLAGAVAFLLVLACANVGSLLLARGSTRRREFTTRVALGAGQGRLVRQLLVEALLLAIAGGSLGLVVARAALATLVALVPDGLPRADEIALDGRALAVTGLIVVLATFAFGLGPALSTARVGVGRGKAGPGRRGGALVVVQVALALILLAGAGLLIRTFVRLHAADRGFVPDRAFTFALTLPVASYGTDEDPRLAAFADRMAARLATIPGVVAAGASQALPFTVDMNLGSFAIADRPSPSSNPPLAYFFEVTPGYFPALGMRLQRGRLFENTDDARHPRVVIVNESFARRYFPGQDPIGKRLYPPGRLDRGGEIVGVVADVRDGRLATLSSDVVNQLYVPLAQNPYDVLTFVVRTDAGGAVGLRAAIKDAVVSLDPALPVDSLRPLTAWVAGSIARQRLALHLFGAFSATALLLAAMGVYGVVSHTVLRRKREIGIRMALGSGVAQVVRLVWEEGARLVLLGLATGLAGALGLTRWLEVLLYGVSAQDGLTFVSVVGLLAFVALGACLLPALRAARLNPMTVLRKG